MPDCSDSAIGATVAGMLAASERVLYLRLDGIGDTVLANGALARLAALMPKARVTAVCDTPVAPVYESCPLVDRVVSLSRWGLVDEKYLAGAVRLLKTLRPDVVLITTRSSAREHCLLALSLGVPIIALENDLANMGPEEKAFFQEQACCIPSPDPCLTELERYADMLRRLGLPFEGLEPLIWLTDEDRRKAAEIWAETGFAPERTIAIFGAGLAFIRAYLGFGQALRDICKTRGLSVVALGAAQDASVNAHLLAPLREAGVPDTAGAERRRTLFVQHADLTRPGPDVPAWRLPADYIRAAESRSANGLDVVISA